MGTSIPIRIGILLAFPAVLLALRFFPREDLAAIRARVRRLARR
jgi:hypothetical protein